MLVALLVAGGGLILFVAGHFIGWQRGWMHGYREGWRDEVSLGANKFRTGRELEIGTASPQAVRGAVLGPAHSR